MPTEEPPAVYIFTTRTTGSPSPEYPESHHVVAMTADGEILASHICSGERWFYGDLHDRKRGAYEATFGPGAVDGKQYLVRVLPVGALPPADVLAKAGPK